MEPQVQDFNSRGREVSMMLVGMLQKLEELEHAGARSVALEMESMVEEQRTLVDHLGRKNILELCRQIHESCRQLSAAEQQRRLEQELRDAVMGKSRWLNAPELGVAQSNAEPEAEPVRDVADEVDSVMVVAEPEAADAEGDDLQASHLLVARGKQPLSLWDWKIWTMAKPRLWRYGDAGNLFGRDTNLSTTEWAACLLLREELQYAVDRDVDDSQAPVRTGMASQSDAVDFQAPVRTGMASQSAAVDYLQDDAPGLVAPGQGLQSAAVDGEEDGRGEAARLGVGSQLVCNRFSGDWAALHMLATVCRLTDQRAASYHFLKNGGMAFAKKLEKLSAADLASAARVAPGAGGMEEFLKEPAVPRTVKDALYALNSASATVVARMAIVDCVDTKASPTWRLSDPR